MKILFAANRFPYPPYRGDKLKIFNLTRRLAKNHELHLITFLENETDKQYLPELNKIFKSIQLIELPKAQSYINVVSAALSKTPFQVAYFKSKEMKVAIDSLLQKEKFDVIHIQHLRMAQYFENIKNTPRILDLPDAYSLYWKRRIATSTGLKKKFNTIEFQRVDAYEKILNKFDLTLTCSKEDQKWLVENQGIENVKLLPNGVDTETFLGEKHNYQNNHIILFTGNMDYAPNVDAVQYFVKDIFPRIKQRCPNITFIIAGQRPVAKVVELASNDIKVTGFVKDLKEMYANTSIVVAPLRFGAGTQNKVLEAMAMAVPVVSMNVGFSGLNIHSGEGVILSPTTDLFVNNCISLLENEILRKEIGQKGKKVIDEQFDWDVITKQLESYFLEICTAKHKH